MIEPHGMLVGSLDQWSIAFSSNLARIGIASRWDDRHQVGQEIGWGGAGCYAELVHSATAGILVCCPCAMLNRQLSCAELCFYSYERL